MIEERLLNILRKDAQVLKIVNSNSGVRSLADLLCGMEPDVIHDNSDWNPQPRLMQDVIGGMIPDIVLRSPLSGENRIYIEVKDSAPLGYGIEDSQVVRYFLYLLATTRRIPKKGATDMRRAILLCAPSEWFQNDSDAKSWTHFVQHFSGLARTFEITLGEMRADIF